MSLLPLNPSGLTTVAVPVALALAGALVLGPTAAAAPQVWEPPGHTIVDVRGNQDNGFDVEHYDGTTDYPPTRSEARAECGEYDTRAARVRCRSEVRTSYDYLGELKRSLRYVRSQS